jgi:hypothetical protein
MAEIEVWRRVWRDGVAPCLSTRGLQQLRRGLANDDPGLTQGSTTSPPPLECCLDFECEGACLIGYCGWQGDELETVGEIEEYFAQICLQADQRLREPAAVRYLLNWFDDTPRDEMRRLLLDEVNRELATRCDAPTPERVAS